jgi:hypothetical protein
MMIFKVCKKHGDLNEEKIIKSGIRKNGSRLYKCKFCHQEVRKNNYLKNKDKIKLKNKLWKEKNPERAKELNKRYKKKKIDDFQEKIKFYESLKPSVLKASKKLIGCIIELNRMKRRVNKKCR